MLPHIGFTQSTDAIARALEQFENSQRQQSLNQPLLRPARADSALAGREIGPGRSEGGGRSKVAEFFSSIKDGFAKFFGVGKHSDSVGGFMRANPGLQQLMTPREGSRLNEPGILGRLEAHGAHGSKASSEQIRAFAAAGERIAAALAEATPDEARSGRLTVDGVEVKSSVFTTRALTWHLMAQAAAVDQDKGVEIGNANSAMVDSGTIVMNDPDNKFFNFLNAAPTSYGRFSSHFRERAPADAPQLLGKPVQRGVEDFQNLLPGHGGSLLFDRIRPSEDAIARGHADTGQLFIKLEHVGTPMPLRATEAHEGLAHAVSNAFSSIARWVEHSFSFLATRNPDNNASEGVVRQEHVYKGRLKETVADPYRAALGQLREQGVIDGDTEASMDKEIGRHGAQRILTRIDQFLAIPQVEGTPAQERLAGVRDALVASTAALADDNLGIERRGVEVHLDWVPRRDLD